MTRAKTLDAMIPLVVFEEKMTDAYREGFQQGWQECFEKSKNGGDSAAKQAQCEQAGHKATALFAMGLHDALSEPHVSGGFGKSENRTCH